MFALLTAFRYIRKPDICEYPGIANSPACDSGVFALSFTFVKSLYCFGSLGAIRRIIRCVGPCDSRNPNPPRPRGSIGRSAFCWLKIHFYPHFDLWDPKSHNITRGCIHSKSGFLIVAFPAPKYVAEFPSEVQTPNLSCISAYTYSGKLATPCNQQIAQMGLHYSQRIHFCLRAVISINLKTHSSRYDLF